MRTRPALLALCFLLAAPALAATKVSEQDLQKIIRIRRAKAKIEATKYLKRTDKERNAAAEAELQKAEKETGWSDDQLGELQGAVEQIEGTLAAMENDAENRAAYEEQLKEESDPAAVALVRKNLKALDYDDMRKAAEEQLRNEEKQESIGKPPSKADLQGAWKFDLDATMAHLEKTMGKAVMEGDTKKKIADSLKEQGVTTYTFKGDEIEQKTVRPGSSTPSVNKGPYRLEGNTLYAKTGKREVSMTVGIKSPTELVISFMGMGTVYKKQ